MQPSVASRSARAGAPWASSPSATSPATEIRRRCSAISAPRRRTTERPAMASHSPPRHAVHSLNDVARRLAPHPRIISASRPTPVLRDHNVLAMADEPEEARRVVLALESIEHADEQLGTVVMSAVPGTPERLNSSDNGELTGHVDPEGVGRHVLPGVLLGGLIGAIVGALIVGGAAL